MTVAAACRDRARTARRLGRPSCAGGPLVVLGTAGSGTRVASDVLELAGVFMGRDRNCERDHRAFIAKVS